MSLLASEILNCKKDAVPINENSVRNVEDVHMHNPIVSNVIRDIIEDAFSVQPVVYMGNVKIVIKDRMRELLEEIIIPCCKKNIVNIFKVGVGLLVVAKSKDPRWEKVVKFPEDKGTLYTYYDFKSETQKFFYERASSKLLIGFMGIKTDEKKVKVLSGFGYDPDINGNLRSRVMSLVEEHAFIHRLHGCYTLAVEKASDPIIFTQLPEKASNPDDQYSSGLYGDRVKYKPSDMDRFARSVEEVEAAKQNSELAIAIRKCGTGSSRSLEYQDHALKNMSIVGPYKLKPLNPGHVVARVEPPQPPPSFDKLKEMSQEIFSAMMGGVKGQAFGKDSKTAAGTKAVTEQYNRNLLSVKKMAGNIMTECYNMLYKDDDMAEALEELLVSRTGSISKSLVAETVDGMKVTISLPAIPSDSSENMFSKYCMGSITKEELDTSNRISVGLSSDVAQHPHDREWTEAMKIYGANSMVKGVVSSTPFGKGMKEYMSELSKTEKGEEEKKNKPVERTKKHKSKKKKYKSDSSSDSSHSSSQSENSGDENTKKSKKRSREQKKEGEKDRGDGIKDKTNNKKTNESKQSRKNDSDAGSDKKKDRKKNKDKKKKKKKNDNDNDKEKR